MKALRRFLIPLVSIAVLLVVAGAVLLRHSRGSFATAFEIRPGLAQVMFTGAHAYAYAMRADSRILLFDTGTDPSGRAIDALLASLYASHNEVADIFLTHGHADHVRATLFPHARVHAGAADVDLIARKIPPSRWLPALLSWLAPVPGADVTDPINGPSEIPVGEGRSVRAIPMPGHTPGSFAYLFNGVLFTGDSLALDHGKLGVGPKVFSWDSSIQEDSIRNLQRSLSATVVDIICTGHGGCSRSGEGNRLLKDASGEVVNWAPLF